MNTPEQDRVPYSYDDIFPERFLHAPDLDGRTVTLTITDAWGEYVQNPKQKRKKERGDLCGILAFRGTKREYAMSKQNAWILKALWGKDPAAYIGKHITLAPVPDTSGFTEHNTRILFVGSPDIDNDLAFTLPGGQQMTFKKTVANVTTVTEASVDSVTGEVSNAEDAAPATDAPLSRDVEAEGVSVAAEAAPDGTEAESDDDEPPGRGALFDADDPKRPCTAADKRHLSEALKHLPESLWTAHLKTAYGKERGELTHGEAVEMTAWATAQVLS